MHKNHFKSDSPVHSNIEDKFQRYGFAKNIAKSIIDSNSPNSLVIAIYGSWGEGKTSVINFIKNELSNNSDDSKFTSFNPWRFSSEESMLYDFFTTLHNEVVEESQATKSKWKKLSHWFNTKLNKIRPWQKRFSGSQSQLNSLGIYGAASTYLANVIFYQDIEKRRNTLINELKSFSGGVVIFIDDVDRLDTEEIYSLFRLVKLTADLPNTTFVLSFDINIVASSLDKRYGPGSSGAGLKFIEKIVQVPISLPVIPNNLIQAYLDNQLKDVLSRNLISLSSQESIRFSTEFGEMFSTKIKTPRQIILFINTVSFSIPLLRGEVNIVDLLLIEATRLFIPEYYNFIKSNEEGFTNELGSLWSRSSGKSEKEKQFIGEFDKIKGINNYTETESKTINSFLNRLFPILKSNMGNHHFSTEEKEKWHRAQRICAPLYFNRYFTYSLSNYDISDVSFNQLINDITGSSIEKSIEILKKGVSMIPMTSFLFKLRMIIEKLDDASCQSLYNTLLKSTNLFPVKVDVLSSIASPHISLSKVLFKLIERAHKNDSSLSEDLSIAIKSVINIEVAAELYIVYRDSFKNEKMTDNDDLVNTGHSLIERFLSESKESYYFYTHQRYSTFISSLWHRTNKPEFKNYIQDFLNSNSQNVLDFLYAITPTKISSNHPTPFKANFTNEEYDWVKRHTEVNDIHERLVNTLGESYFKQTALTIDDFSPEFANTKTNVAIQFGKIHYAI